MARPSRNRTASILLATLTLLLAPLLVVAHGENDGVENFHEHLDDYAAEVDQLSGRFRELVAQRAAGEEVTEAQLDGLVDAWEDVDIHLAIELEATPLYPGVWQALIGFRQAVDADKPVAELRARADAMRGALLQGLGALKLAASQVDSSEADNHRADRAMEPMDADATVDAILAELDQAVEAYRADDLKKAQALIHSAYMERFEGLEGDLIAQDPELVSDLEAAFNARLPLLMQDGAALDAVRTEVRDMNESLERARALLQDRDEDRSEVF